jgi:formamidopyrimidine-DNA glycosylase
MPELPDITVYVEQLAKRLAGASLFGVTIASPNLLRTFDPPAQAAVGMRVTGVERIGKRIAIGFDSDLWFVLHLMIAGRLQWTDGARPAPAKLGKIVQARFVFSSGTLALTEAGTKKRSALHVVRGRDALAGLDAGGIDVLTASPEAFREALRRENHTLKRSLGDPRVFSGIGNAYSDEILHAARLSPTQLTKHLEEAEIERLREATVRVLEEWTGRLRAETGDAFPANVTAFRPEMAVHGKYREPCPVCGSPIQRIVRGDHETNYCPTCQTGGKLLADRALSRLLKADWPQTLEELEELRSPPSPAARPTSATRDRATTAPGRAPRSRGR